MSIKSIMALVSACTVLLVPVACKNLEDNEEPTLTTILVLDQQNLLGESLGGQGIGRFSDYDGTPDPDGTTFDHQDAQTFIAGVSGLLSQIRLPLRNLYGATQPVILDLREVIGEAPDEDDGPVIGTVSLGAAVFADVDTVDPSTWPPFDVSRLGVEVTAGGAYAFSVRTADTKGYIYNPEHGSGYPSGSGYRRNRAVTATWERQADFGFQTFVLPR